MVPVLIAVTQLETIVQAGSDQFNWQLAAAAGIGRDAGAGWVVGYAANRKAASAGLRTTSTQSPVPHRRPFSQPSLARFRQFL